MSAVLEAHEPSARYLEAVQPALVRQFDLLATAPGAVRPLRELILALAVQGKLVRQDASDEPASDLLERIAGERARLIAAGKLRKSKDSTEDDASDPPYSLPQGWAWSKLAVIGVINPRNDAADDVVASFVQMSSIPVAFNDPHTTEARPWHDIKAGFTQFAEGDVGVAKITPCFENGKSTVFQNLSNGIGAGTTELHIVRPLCGVAPRYVLLFLKSPRFLREGEATMTGTAGQKRLPRSFFENCPFPLPPLEEQARIVARVDELMRLCDALEAKGRLEAEQHARLLGTLLGTLTDSSTPEELAANWQRVADHFDLLLDRPEAVEALEQTILQLAVRGLLIQQNASHEPADRWLGRMNTNRVHRWAAAATPTLADTDRPGLPAGWCVTNVGSVAECLDYVRRPIKKSDREAGGGSVPYYGANGRVGWIDEHLFNEDLVLVVEDETFIGRTKPFSYVVRGKSWVNNHAHVLRPLGGLSADFLNLCLERYDFIPLTSGTTNRRKLTQPGLLNAEFMIGPLEEQARILARVTELRRLCADLRQRLTAIQTTQAHLAEALVDEVAA